jgi:hypothetical protein
MVDDPAARRAGGKDYDFARRAPKATSDTAAPTPHFATGWVSSQVR